MSLNSPNITVMITAARKAARTLVRDFGEVENLQTSIKGVGDFVSAADIRSEEIIHDELMRARPGLWLVSARKAARKTARTRSAAGSSTRSTERRISCTAWPHFAVSIALEQKGEIVAGVVFDPIKNELFVAEKGGGAYMNDRRIRVSARKELTEAVLSTGVPFGAKKTLPLALKDLAQLMPATAGCAASARRLLISPMSRRDDMRRSGNERSTPGTWRPASLSRARRARWSPISTAAATCSTGETSSRPRRRSMSRSASTLHPDDIAPRRAPRMTADNHLLIE